MINGTETPLWRRLLIGSVLLALVAYLATPFYLPRSIGAIDDLRLTRFGGDHFNTHANYQINHAQGTIDFLFVGSSGIATGIKPDAFADAYAERTGTRPTVVNLSHLMQAPGYDYLLTKRLLETRQVGTLVLQAPEHKGTDAYGNLKYVWDWRDIGLDVATGYQDGGGGEFPYRSFFYLYLEQLRAVPELVGLLFGKPLPPPAYEPPPSIRLELESIGHFNGFRTSIKDNLVPIEDGLTVDAAWDEDVTPLLYDATQLPEIYLDTGISAKILSPFRKMDETFFIYTNWENYFYRKFADLAKRHGVAVYYLARIGVEGRPLPDTGYASLPKPDFYAPTLIIPVERVFPGEDIDGRIPYFADRAHMNDVGGTRFSRYLALVFSQLQ